MPPLPMKAMISSCGKSFATSSTLGGANGVISGCVAVSVESSLRRHARQSPSSAPVGSGAPHWGHFLGIFASDSFIYLSQKEIREDVTEKMRFGEGIGCM